MIFTGILMVIFAQFKAMSMMRYDEDFGQFVELFINSINGIKVFLCFLFGWLLIFSVIFTILGVKFYESEEEQKYYKSEEAYNYPLVNPYCALLIQIFRNSMGDIAPPKYPHWI